MEPEIHTGRFQDELSIELLLPSLPSSDNVADKKKGLRDRLRAERKGESRISSEFSLDLNNEMKVCSRKFTSLEQMLRKFDSYNFQNKYARLTNRLMYSFVPNKSLASTMSSKNVGRIKRNRR